LAGGVAQVVECLLSKHEALNSRPSTEKKKKIKKERKKNKEILSFVTT
jgi:hypothetical protein